MLDAQALVESPAAAGKSPSFAAVFQGLGEEQKKASLGEKSPRRRGFAALRLSVPRGKA